MIETNIIRVPAASLHEHPLNAKYYEPAAPGQDSSLLESLKAHGQRTPLIVCGPGCASPEWTVLSGHRRLKLAPSAGLTEVLVTVLEGLSEDDEEFTILRENKAAYEHRTLSDEARHKHEKRIAELLGNRQGARSDLDPTKPVGATPKLVAQQLGTTESAVRNRGKVFGSDVSPPELKTAVNEGKLPRSKAAAMVRAVEGEVKEGTLPKDEAPKALQKRTQAEVEARSAERRSRKPKKVERAGAVAEKTGPSAALEATDNGDLTTASFRQAVRQAKLALGVMEDEVMCGRFDAQLEDEDREALTDWFSSLNQAVEFWRGLAGHVQLAFGLEPVRPEPADLTPRPLVNAGAVTMPSTEQKGRMK